MPQPPRTIEERKRKLDGRVLRYACEALEISPERAVVLYRMTAALDLAGVAIPADAVSYGLYWAERPFNVYRWGDPRGAVLAYYCNVAAETRISPEAVEWLDLEVDVLITPDGRVRVLDEEDVPADLAPRYRAALEQALGRLRAPGAVVAEVEACLAGLGGPAPARDQGSGGGL